MSVYDLAEIIGKIQPGHWHSVGWRVLHDIPPMPMVGIFGLLWSAEDQIMEKIVGSAYEFKYFRDELSGNVIFERLKEPLQNGARTYVSPDRREHFELRGGYYWPRARNLESAPTSCKFVLPDRILPCE